MSLSEKITTWIVWHLPRSVAYWAYIRVATAGDHPGTAYAGNPAGQSVIEPMQRWETAG